MYRFVRLSGLSIALLGLGLVAFAQAGSANEAKPAPAAKKNIDIALCLDVSGSMNGLIDSAKAKLWDIVNQLAKVQPTPNLRVALYSYGHDTYDRNKGWVRKDLDLSHDLDMLYQKLFALTINGGTEYVTRVSRDAVIEQAWSKEKDALKLIFVCGNEPANQDPQVSMKQAADDALAKGIIINTIYCGRANDGDAKSWREFAGLAQGRFATIDQNQQVVINTPFDKQLVELGGKMNETYVGYGKGWHAKQTNQAAQDKNAGTAGAAVFAERVVSKNSGLYRCEEWDLVDRCKTDPKFDITKVPAEELPDNLKKLKPEERVKYVKDMTAKRETLQKEVTEINNKRTAYINQEMKRNPNQADQAFFAAIRETLRTQAAAKGITIPE